uniref:Uncharacterized protein n=1 Tax=Panagrolaimus sp. ES5 TaxID=591445 RepID=A0AC34F1M5_9BILA
MCFSSKGSNDNSTSNNSVSEDDPNLPPTNDFPIDQTLQSSTELTGKYCCEMCKQISGSSKLADFINELEILINTKPPGRPLKIFTILQANGSRKMTTKNYEEKKKQERIHLKSQAEDLMKVDNALKEMIKENQHTFSPDQKQSIEEILREEWNLLKRDTSESNTIYANSKLSQTREAKAKRRHDKKKRNEEAEWEKKIEVLPMIHKKLQNVIGVIEWMENAAFKKAIFFSNDVKS